MGSDGIKSDQIQNLCRSKAKHPRVAPFDASYGWDANSDCFAGDMSGGTILAWETSGFSDWQGFWNPLLTLVYIGFSGTMGFLYAAADLSGLVEPKKPETFPGCYAAFMADADGTFVGGFLGASSVTTYGQSMASVCEGGRTGLTKGRWSLASHES